MTEEIEIPFGAFDSETIGWTYTIPEGFTAKIEDGKIVVEKKAESADEEIINGIIRNLEYLLHNTFCAEETKRNLENRINWLKSLRPHHHWKPCEEQMDALYTAAQEAPIIKEDGNYLYDLYNDLKKL